LTKQLAAVAWHIENHSAGDSVDAEIPNIIKDNQFEQICDLL
jgi:hypothetical protein